MLTLHFGEQEVATNLSSHLNVSNNVCIAAGAFDLSDLEVGHRDVSLRSADWVLPFAITRAISSRLVALLARTHKPGYDFCWPRGPRRPQPEPWQRERPGGSCWVSR